MRRVRELLRWPAPLLAPVQARLQRQGVLATAPITLSIVVLSFIATASVGLSRPIADAADTVLVYRGRDLFHGALWRLPASALLAQSWWQWVSTVAIAGLAAAALEVRISGRALVVCLLLCHCLPTIAVGMFARLTDVAELARPDYGMSCIMIGAVATLATRARSAPLALLLMLSLAGDPLFNSGVTIAEHLLAAAIGGGAGALLGRTRQPVGELVHLPSRAPAVTVEERLPA